MKTRKMMLCVAAMLFVLSMPAHAAGQEEPEMTTYSFDFSLFVGGDPDDYEYSFDKENWTKDRTWEVEVGKDYELYVKYPDGNVGLISFFKGGDKSPMGESPEAGSGTSEPKETAPAEGTEPDGTKGEDKEGKEDKAEKGTEAPEKTEAEAEEDAEPAGENQEGFLKAVFVVLLLAVVALFGGGFVFLQSRGKSK